MHRPSPAIAERNKAIKRYFNLLIKDGIAGKEACYICADLFKVEAWVVRNLCRVKKLK